ncbi:MAG: type II toxin-antitoxin system VapC family toxin [Bacillota bacterium]
MESKRLTLYVDTSVIGGYFDIEFEKETRILFDNIESQKYDIMYSSVTEDELLNAPEQVKNLLGTIPSFLIKRVSLTEEAVKLADTYISEGVVGKTSRDDCFHIALATINKADILVSWNFKHIVNIFRIRGYNAVNLKLGYSQIDIRSPKEIITNEE